MRFYRGNKTLRDDLLPFDVRFTNGKASRLLLPRGICAMAQDWGSTTRHPCATRWVWKPGEGAPLTDSLFFIREMLWPSYPPPAQNDPRANPSYGQLHTAILQTEKELGIKSEWGANGLSIHLRLGSHERPEASAAYLKDYQAPLYFKPIDTKEAKEGILHLQELLHIDPEQFHPFHIDPRTLKTQPMHKCRICGCEHNGLHLRGRPRAFYLVADGQGELLKDQRGKLALKPATDEWAMPRTN